MAKKSYQRIRAYHTQVKSESAETSVITIKGQNSKGTDVEIKVTVEDYFFPYMIKEMADIARTRVKVAINRFDNLKNAIEP